MIEPRLAVVSSLFPSAATPGAGLFVRERMFRVGKQIPVVVISPKPWFPGQGLIRKLRPGYRPPTARHERQDGVDVFYPRFLAPPGILRRFDGWFMALACTRLLGRLRRESGVNLIDAHFAFPDGVAARHLARWHGLPFTVTLRGTEPGNLRQPEKRVRMERVFAEAARVIGVSNSLAQLAARHGAPARRLRVVGNGVDIDKFVRIDQRRARSLLSIPSSARVLISVGGLVERKGFHRVIELLPALRRRWPDLVYLIVGGPSPEGDMGARLREQAARLGCDDIVRFCGPIPAADLHVPLSAADVFVLATRNEGWANVFLEAMACGLPVVTTDVGGNAEVVSSDDLGAIVPFGDSAQLLQAIDAALQREWNREAIMAHAKNNQWTERVALLLAEFRAVVAESGVRP
jgi:teichuronic acid biosynthesis glycosyltransferase TuaC